MIEPMMPSKWLSFRAKCQILVQPSVEEVGWLDGLAKKRVVG